MRRRSPTHSATAAEPPAQPTEATPAATSTISPAPQNASSPLAEAAQKSNAARGKKKSKISINNGNLAKSGGHITTSSMPVPENPTIGPSPASGREQAAAEEKAKKKAAAAEHNKKVAEEKKKTRQERASAGMDDIALDDDDDPAVLEHRMETAATGKTSTQPATTSQKPPV
jgi:hypothetical protein